MNSDEAPPTRGSEEPHPYVSAVRNIGEVLSGFDELWSPRIVVAVNDWHVLVVKVRGDFVWHAHCDTDELFLVLDGNVDIHIEVAGEIHVVPLTSGDVYVVPRGVRHRPVSEAGARLLLLEPAQTLNTGDYEGPIPAHISSTRGIPVDR